MNKDLIYKLLWSAIEEFVGLWELLWEINSELDGNSTTNKELAKKLLLFLLETKLIKLYYNRWGDDQLQEINQQESIEIIKGEKFWLPPEVNEICVKVGSTEKGEKYYNEELIEEVDLS